KIGGDVVLDGTGGFVNYGSLPDLNFAAGSSFTVAGWVKTTDSYGTILSQRSSTNDNPVIDLFVGYNSVTNNAGHLMAFVRDDNDSGNFVQLTGGLINDGNWHHVALTRTGSTITLYLDGVVQGSSSNAGAGGSITTDLRALGSERRWVPGGFSNQDQEYLAGAGDQVPIYNPAFPGP